MKTPDPETREEAAARAEQLYDRVVPILEEEADVVAGTLITSLFLQYIKNNLGDAAIARVMATLEELSVDGQNPSTRWINALVDKGYDWPAKIGKAKKAGK
jgi:hypothetical protein